MRAWLEGSAGTHEEQHCSTHTHVENCRQLQHCHAQAMGDGKGDPGEKEILEMFMTAACKAGGGDSGEVRSGDAAWSGEVRSGEVRGGMWV